MWSRSAVQRIIQGLREGISNGKNANWIAQKAMELAKFATRESIDDESSVVRMTFEFLTESP